MQGGCQDSSFALAGDLSVDGSWQGNQARAVTGIDGVATRSVLQCTSPTSYDVYPPAGSGLAATSFDLDSISGDTQAAVTLSPGSSFSGCWWMGRVCRRWMGLICT